MEENIILLGDLIDILTNIITDIRINQSNIYDQLLININELEQIHFRRTNKDNSVQEMFNAYEKIISVSTKLRSLLQSYELQIAQYDQLDYALYYEGERYYASTADITAAMSYGGIRVTKSGLMIDLKKITENLQQDIWSDCKVAIFNAFNKHYESFRNYASGMYLTQNKKYFGGSGANINMGHVAEAHERHLQEHHKNLFILSTQSDITPTDLIQYRFEEFKQEVSPEHWHTGPEDIWSHIRASLGFQRGTVAGDVNSTQVKQARTTEKSKNTTLRLSSIANLKRGVKVYSAIFNKDILPRQVAIGIAIYISDIMDPQARRTLNAYILPKVLNEDFNIDSFFQQYKQIQINL